MRSPESGTGETAADCGVGSIVWVRRRNGSWWPGKILGPDELSATHVMSPRSGTPVKLLGREDASVDWYNLEKSKRVKSFRCGEFDDCIERAEASLGMPPKKREKYARREDAILHALALERQTLEKKYGKEDHYSNGKSNKSPHDLRDEVLSSEKAGTENRKQLHLETEQAQKSLYLPHKGQSEDHGLCSETVKEGNQLGVDDDNSDVLPRMRGLQDFGLATAATAPSNPRTSPSAPSDVSQKPASDGDCQGTLETCLNTEVTVDGNCENSSIMLHENWDEDSLAKKRNRHRSLDQVLQSSSKLPVSVSQPDVSVPEEEQQLGVPFPAKRSRYSYLASESPDALYETKIHPTRLETLHTKFEESNCMPPADSFEEDATESTEDTETDSSETDSLDSDSDSDSDELATFSEGAASIELEPKYPGLSHAQPEYGSGEEVDGLAHTDEVSHPFQNDLESSSGGVSRWQLKGKRNNRSLLKRPPDGTSRNFLRAYTDETAAINLGTERRKETYLLEKDFKPRMAVRGSRGLDDVACRRSQWDWNDQPPSKGYWEDSAEYFDPELVSHYRNSGKIMLIDVDLKVQSSYQREHVPMISLTSKINGQAIVGHPIQTEALEDGSSESLINVTDDWYPGISDNETNPPPMWKTARRTANIRFRRPAPSTRDESAKHPQFVDGRKGSVGKSNSGTFGYKTGKQSSRKPLRKISTSSNQKIRTLSSISSHQKPSSDPNASGNNYKVNGLIKSDSVPTAVACIPVKLVFSRLQEELIDRHAQ